MTEAAVTNWFSKVSTVLVEAGLGDRPQDDIGRRLWNCDETAFATDVASRKILARKGEKNVHETGGGSGREYITVLGCGSASGERLPPYIVYKGKNLWTSWTKGGPAGTLYTVSDSGWMERPNFLEWFKKQFIVAVSHLLETGPVILFMDGHASHINLTLIRLAREQGVVLLCLPSHTTHVLQPLDVGAFGPVKTAWAKILKEYKMETCAAVVDKTEFPNLLRKLWDASFQPHHLSAGFRRAGLFPLCQDSIPKSSYAPAVPQSRDHDGQLTSTPQPSNAHDSLHTVEVSVKCCDCFTETQLTPVRVYLQGYFAKLIGDTKANGRKTVRRRVKPLYSGEALTTDEIYERLEDDDRKKTEKAQQKAARAGRRKGA